MGTHEKNKIRFYWFYIFFNFIWLRELYDKYCLISETTLPSLSLLWFRPEHMHHFQVKFVPAHGSTHYLLCLHDSYQDKKKQENALSFTLNCENKHKLPLEQFMQFFSIMKPICYLFLHISKNVFHIQNISLYILLYSIPESALLNLWH